MSFHINNTGASDPRQVKTAIRNAVRTYAIDMDETVLPSSAVIEVSNDVLNGHNNGCRWSIVGETASVDAVVRILTENERQYVNVRGRFVDGGKVFVMVGSLNLLASMRQTISV